MASGRILTRVPCCFRRFLDYLANNVGIPTAATSACAPPAQLRANPLWPFAGASHQPDEVDLKELGEIDYFGRLNAPRGLPSRPRVRGGRPSGRGPERGGGPLLREPFLFTQCDQACSEAARMQPGIWFLFHRA